MIKRFSFLAMAAIVAWALCAPAHAGSVIVSEDSGGGSANATGTSTGAIINTAGYSDYITAINYAPLTPPPGIALAFGVNELTVLGNGDVITGGTGTKNIGGVLIHFAITGGSYSTSFADITGKIVSVVAPGTTVYNGTTYDFSHMVGASVALNVSGADFTTIFGHSGATATGVGFDISESQVVPEPASMALLGIGMTGFLAFRRLFKRVTA